jgi:hypothetical protein
MERRHFIRIAGGGVVVAATAGAFAGCSGFGIPASATAAWQPPPNDMDIRRFVLSYALLAPNPHNRQPWIADLSDPEAISLRVDRARLLPETDPFSRQIVMGCGAFVELLRLAATARGYYSEITLFPDGAPSDTLDDRPFARVTLTQSPGVQPDLLFRSALKRRTDRREYDSTRPVATADVLVLQSTVQTAPLQFGVVGQSGNTDDGRVAAIRLVTNDAWRAELITERTMLESMHLLRVGSAEIDEHRDGIVITSPMLVTLKRLGLFSTTTFPAPDSKGTVSQLAKFDAASASTRSYLWLATEGNSREQQLLAGRAYARLNLMGASLGLVMHPNSQALQEYAEVSAQRAAIHTLLQVPAPQFTVQMLARVGYPAAGSDEEGPAPRRGLAAHLHEGPRPRV